MKDVARMMFCAIMAIAPIWILASKVDSDEFVKSGAAIACAGLGAAAMKAMFSSKS